MYRAVYGDHLAICKEKVTKQRLSQFATGPINVHSSFNDWYFKLKITNLQICIALVSDFESFTISGSEA